MSRIHYTKCPICESEDLKTVFQAKDYTVSGELFTIVECKFCTLRFTQDVPDESSIAPYYQSDNYISHSDTKTGLINRLYHFVRKKTLARKRKLVKTATGLPEGQLLDIGSGTGAFVYEMKTNGWDATGLEPDRAARNLANELYRVNLYENSQLYQFASDKFDAITLWHVLEHVHDLQKYIQQIKKILTEKGKLIIAVPNYTSSDAKAYREYWAAYDVPRHLYHFSPQSMRILMERNGLTIEQYKPMWYDSFYISLLSSKYKNKKANLVGAGWSGFRSNLNALADVTKCSSVIYIIKKV